MERSILCWSKCCRPAAPEQPQDEWIEELPPEKKKKKRVSTSIKKEKGKANSRPSLPNQTSVKWADLMGDMEEEQVAGHSHSTLPSLDTEVLSDPRHDEAVYESVNSDDFFETGGGGGGVTLGDIRVSQFLGEDERDSIISSLRSEPESEPDESRNSESSTASLRKRDKLKLAGHKLKEKTKGKFHDIAHKFDDETRGSTSSEDASGSFGFGERGTLDRIANKTTMIGRKLKEKTKAAIPITKKPVQEKARSVSTPRAITSIAVLSDGYFLIASRTDRIIKMFKTVHFEDSSSVEFVRDFEGHRNGVTALVVLDKKGRFLTAGKDKTVRLWDSRFNCEDDSSEEAGNVPKPRTLLATFDNPDGRWVRCIGVLCEGSFVRPTDDVDAAMLKAVARKAALEGTASTQRAAAQREIIECSGSFATASANGMNANIWEMTSAKYKADEDVAHRNVAGIDLAHVLTHESSIQALATMQEKVVTGDVMGEVYLWEPRRTSLFSRKNWINTRVFTPWKDRGLHTPEQISKQAILNVCFLNKGSKFVAASNNGTIRVWDISKSKRGDVVHKKQAHSVKVTSESLSGIQKLPNVEDPDTGEECLAFTVASTDGRVVSMALNPSNSSRHGNELVIFEMNDYSDKGGMLKSENAIHAIAVSEVDHQSIVDNDSYSAPVVIAGDESGSIHLSSPYWSSDA